MARGRTSSGIQLDLIGLNTVQAWWAVLQLRQLQRLAIDVLYCVVERWLGKQCIIGSDTTIDSCASDIASSVIGGLENEFQHQVISLVEFFIDGCKDADSLYTAASRESPEVQLDLFNHITELFSADMQFSETGANKAITIAYKALVFCAVETSNLLNVSDTQGVLQKDQDSCSLIALKNLVYQMSDASPKSLMSYLIKHWVVLRHFRIVADRSRNADGKNRFRFVVGDFGLERFDPSTKMPGPAFAQDRLKHILILCAQSGLLKSQNMTYQLSEYGESRVLEGIAQFK